MRSLVFLIFVALVGGCLGPSMKKYEPVRVTGGTEDLYRSSVRAVGEVGQTIEQTNEDAGIITTRWEEEGMPGKSQMRYRFRVQVYDQEASVYIDCQVKFVKSSTAFTGEDDMGPWEKCEGDEVPKHRVTIANELADAIVAN